MPLYEMNAGLISPVLSTSFKSLGMTERNDLQSALKQQIAAITPSTRTMVLAEEFSDWVDANRRIDLLCLDDEARLVVVELKREHSGHMELQALRYAAMVSTMTFEQAVDAHRRYLRAQGATVDAEQAIRDFLEVGDDPVALSESIRLVLVAAEFSTELTTTVLWLNHHGLDIRCVQIQPHLMDKRVLLDIQQVIPLPATEQYQVALREKSQEQVAVVQSRSKDYTRYNLQIGETSFTNLPKRRLVYHVIAEAIRRGVGPLQIARAISWKEKNLFIKSEQILDSSSFLDAMKDKDLPRYFTADEDLFHIDGNTWAVSNQWGNKTIDGVDKVLALMPKGEPIEYHASIDLLVLDEASFAGYVIRQMSDNSIELLHQGVPKAPVRPELCKIAQQLGVSTSNAQGNEVNTRKLGSTLIRTIKTRG